MPLIERLMAFWQCARCAGEWPALNPEKRPKACRFCRHPDWFEGAGKLKFKKARIVRVVGKKAAVMRQSGKSILDQVKRIERDLERR
jgi:hypothetical protein